MKYSVDIGGRRVLVALTGDRARIGDEEWQVSLTPIDGTPSYVLAIGDRRYRVVARKGEARGLFTLWLDGQRFDAEALDERSRTIREMADAHAPPKGPAPVRAPMPGLIIRVAVAVGDAVRVGQGVIVMEAMKMENELRAETAGTVRAIHAIPGRAVERGAVLVELA